MKILVGGSHGLIGEALVERLQELDHEPVRLVRTTSAGGVIWNPLTGQVDSAQLEGFEAVVHLGGVGIGERRWSEKVREQLWNSRVASTELLATKLAELTYKPRTFVCASAVGYYGNRGDEPLTEESTKGEGFLADMCATWEDATTPASDVGIRVVNLRSGVVLSDRGGSLQKQVPIFRAWMGGRLGSGQQWLPWISLQDEVEAIVHALTHEELHGPINVVSPNPVTNVEFTYALSVALGRIAAIPTPRWTLKLALGAELTDEVILASQCAYPTRLSEGGFEFADTDIHEYLKELFSTPPPEQEQNPDDDLEQSDGSDTGRP